MEKSKLSGQATPEQIAVWKQQYGDIFSMVVKDKIGYLKRPDRATLSAATSVGDQDPMKFNEILFENCWIGGDEAIKTDDNYFLAAIGELKELVDFGKASLKKL